MGENEKLTGREKFDIVVEAGLQMIPTIGGPLASAYFGTKNEKRFKRIESFYEEFSRKMQEIDYRFKSIKTHDEDALIAIIERLNEKIELEAIKEKREFYKKYLLHTLTQPTNKSNFDERRFFIDTLADMTLLEIDLLFFLQKENCMINVEAIQKPGVDQSVIVGIVGRLKNYGFIDASQQRMSLGGTYNNALGQAIIINDFGKRFFGFCLSD